MKLHSLLVGFTPIVLALSNGQQNLEARDVAAVRRGNIVRDAPVIEERTYPNPSASEDPSRPPPRSNSSPAPVVPPVYAATTTSSSRRVTTSTTPCTTSTPKPTTSVKTSSTQSVPISLIPPAQLHPGSKP